MKTPLETIEGLLSRIKMNCLGKSFSLKVERDIKSPKRGRIFLQVWYIADCVKTGEPQVFRGRKFYLSDHMTADEIVKTAYLAFKLAVEHEIMEGFTVDNIRLFNPHVDFEQLLIANKNEVSRETTPPIQTSDAWVISNYINSKP